MDEAKNFYEEINAKDLEFINDFKARDAYKAFKNYFDTPHKDESVRYVKYNKLDYEKITVSLGQPRKPKNAEPGKDKGLEFVEGTLGYKDESNEMKRLVISFPPMFASKVSFDKKRVSFKLNYLDDDYKDLYGEYSKNSPGEIDLESFFGQFYDTISLLLEEKRIKIEGKELLGDDLKVKFGKDSGIPLWWDKKFEEVMEGKRRVRKVVSAEALMSCKIRVDEEFKKQDGSKIMFNTEFIHMQGGQPGIRQIIRNGKEATDSLSSKSLVCLIYMDMSRVLVSGTRTQATARVEKIRYLPVELPSSKMKGNREEEIFTIGDTEGLDMSSPSKVDSSINERSSPEQDLATLLETKEQE